MVYKAFDNMDGFKRLFGFEPNTKIAVLIFGLFHGFGLATKLQELDLSKNGLVTNIVSFNVGVEIGQVLALTAVVIAAQFLANAARLLPLRLRHQYGADGGGLRSGRISDNRIFCGIARMIRETMHVEQRRLPAKRRALEEGNPESDRHRAGVALVILFTAVLPAEYGIDPLKTGALLGLTDLSKAAEPAEANRCGARPHRRRPAFTPRNRNL